MFTLLKSVLNVHLPVNLPNGKLAVVSQFESHKKF
jgi:hypothetical protein